MSQPPTGHQARRFASAGCGGKISKKHAISEESGGRSAMRQPRLGQSSRVRNEMNSFHQCGRKMRLNGIAYAVELGINLRRNEGKNPLEFRTLTKNAVDTRSRILNAAADLFDRAGIRGATLDAIAASAGVTKKTLYYHFRSKDDLVAASLSRKNLDEHDDARLAVAGAASLHDFVGRLFADIAGFAADPHWQGCAFTRAAFELAGMPGHPGVVAAKSYKNRLEKTFLQELDFIDLAQARAVARRLILLLDGAITHCVIHHDPEYAVEAGRLASELISAAKANTHERLKPAAVSMPVKWNERSPSGTEDRSLQVVF